MTVAPSNLNSKRASRAIEGTGSYSANQLGSMVSRTSRRNASDTACEGNSSGFHRASAAACIAASERSGSCPFSYCSIRSWTRLPTQAW